MEFVEVMNRFKYIVDMDDMDDLEMCGVDCEDCPFSVCNNGKEIICRNFITVYPKEFEEIVNKEYERKIKADKNEALLEYKETLDELCVAYQSEFPEEYEKDIRAIFRNLINIRTKNEVVDTCAKLTAARKKKLESKEN